MFKTVNKNILKVFRPRKPDSHKYDFGHLLVIGGSKQYFGSVALAILAALRSGVDLVTIVAPERAANLASVLPDLITYPLKGNYLNKNHLKELLEFAKNKTGIVIGGGLCRKPETLKTVNLFLKKINLPTVIDADAIHAVAQDKGTIKNKPFVITPHAYEFYVLTGVKIGKKSFKEKIKIVEKFASELGTTILLKGNVDIISDGKQTAVNKTGNPFMTVGGTGDTLAGIVGSLLAQNIPLFDAACAGAWINGRAGDIAAKQKKQGLIASDLIEAIPKVL